ncbi:MULTISPECIES: 4Fe-4S binding protein [unclassified Methanobrevibacter]|uniref:4Fe-4S binding protein n=1 Tax=unclassified Methanobrevibacter TaxID=2638681 RepID=UPI002733969C|nr:MULTISPECIES: 4Fe-4S binding protein [unclassified Methanobrevibacter]
MGLGSFFKRGKESKKEEVIEDCHINIRMEDCDACEKCAIACPNNVLQINKNACSVRDSRVCKNCKICMAICPNECITIN